MVSFQDQVMLRIAAQNLASSTAKQVDKDFQSMASNITQSISSISSGMLNIGSVTDNMMQGLSGKSALDNILGTSSKAETNNVLLKNMTETEDGAKKLFDTVDSVTDNSLTSMQELIPAMKAFKSATGASDDELIHVTDEMANFGASVLAQTGSAALAEQSMMDLSKGIKGAFASLDQYGITEDSLKRTGYWNGDEKDVEGFMKAVQDVTGSTEELMETNQGLDALIGKSFSRAGKKMGNEFLPWIKDIKRGFLDLDDELGGNLTASMLAVSGGVEVMNQGLWNVSTTVQGVKDLKEGLTGVKDVAKGVTSALKGVGKTGQTMSVAGDTIGNAAAHANGGFSFLPDGFNPNDFKKGAGAVEEVVEDSAKVGELAPKAAASSVAIEETATATTTLSGAFTSMIVPLLAISAVIAVMIPIAAGLAAEALLFLKAIQTVFDALDFGSIDLTDDIEGIKQLTEGLAWVGVAMGAMSFSSVMTGLAVITGGFLGITGPLSIAVDSLTEASSLLSEFSSVGIDDNVPKNLKNISESLTAVSEAMTALTGTNIATGFSNFVSWVFQFSSTTDAIRQAKKDLIDASTAINELASGINPLSDEDAAKIKNVCESLASVGDAMSALRSMRDDANWDANIRIFPDGFDIQTALKNVKKDISKAATALSNWNLPELPEDIGKKVKTVSETLTSLSESFESLRSLRDDVNWDNFVGGIFKDNVDIQGALSSIKTELYYTATNLNGLSGMPEIQEGIGDKVKNVTSTLSAVSDAVTGLTSVPDMGDYNSANISTAVTNIQNAATELSKLNETTFNGDTANGVLTSISTTIENIKTTLSGASGFSDPATNIGSEIVNGVQTGLSPLTSIITTEITTATNSSASAGWTGGSYIGTSTTNGLKSALQLKTTMETEVSYALTAMTSKVQEFYDAGAALGSAANEGFQSQDAINPGSPGNLAHVMMDEVDYILKSMTDNYGVAKNVAAGFGSAIYEGFGNPDLGVNSTYDFSPYGLQTSVSQVPDSQQNKTVNIFVGEGAFYIDARNKTEKEAARILTLGLESLDVDV